MLRNLTLSVFEGTKINSTKWMRGQNTGEEIIRRRNNRFFAYHYTFPEFFRLGKDNPLEHCLWFFNSLF